MLVCRLNLNFPHSRLQNININHTSLLVKSDSCTLKTEHKASGGKYGSRSSSSFTNKVKQLQLPYNVKSVPLFMTANYLHFNWPICKVQLTSRCIWLCVFNTTNNCINFFSHKEDKGIFNTAINVIWYEAYDICASYNTTLLSFSSYNDILDVQALLMDISSTLPLPVFLGLKIDLKVNGFIT